MYPVSSAEHLSDALPFISKSRYIQRLFTFSSSIYLPYGAHKALNVRRYVQSVHLQDAKYYYKSITYYSSKEL